MPVKALVSDFNNVIVLRNQVINGQWLPLVVNQDLLNFYQTLKLKLKLYLFTASNVDNFPEVKTKLTPIFQKIFSTQQEPELTKKDPQSYQVLAERLKLNPDQIIFIDDNPANIQAANLAGYHTVLFENNHQAKTEINRLLALDR